MKSKGVASHTSFNHKQEDFFDTLKVNNILSLYFPSVYSPVPVSVFELLFRERELGVCYCTPNLHNGGALGIHPSVTASIKNSYLVLNRFDTKAYRLLRPARMWVNLANPFGFLPGCNSNFHFFNSLFCEDTLA